MFNQAIKHGALAALGVMAIVPTTGCKKTSTPTPFVRSAAYASCSVIDSQNGIYTLKAQDIHSGKPVSMKHSSLDGAYMDAARLCIPYTVDPSAQ